MISIGSEYQITFGNHGDWEAKYGIAISFVHPLLVLQDRETEKEIIYNISNPAIFKIEKR